MRILANQRHEANSGWFFLDYSGQSSGSVLHSWPDSPYFESWSKHSSHCIFPVTMELQTFTRGRLNLAIPLQDRQKMRSRSAETTDTLLPSVHTPNQETRSIICCLTEGYRNRRTGPTLVVCGLEAWFCYLAVPQMCLLPWTNWNISAIVANVVIFSSNFQGI